MKNSAINMKHLDNSVLPLGYMAQAQSPLRKCYAEDGDAALVTDWAKTSSKNISASDALHAEVVIDSANPTTMCAGVHKAVGGESDFATPGDLLCGALACCLDSTIRIISNLIGVELADLSVEVKGQVDVRGTLMMDPDVPVAFQKFNVIVSVGTSKPLSDANLKALIAAAERSCIVMQTLKASAEIVVVLS